MPKFSVDLAALPNQPISLRKSVPVRLSVRRTKQLIGDFRADARVRMVPSPRVELEITSDDVTSKLFDPALLSDPLCVELSLPPDGTARFGGLLCDAKVSFSGNVSSGKVIIIPEREPLDLPGDSDSHINFVSFLLVNFKPFQKPTKTREQYRRISAVSYFKLSWKNFVVHVEQCDKAHETLKREGGYAVTHVGKLQREDEGAFAVAEAKNVMEALGYAFSFLSGQWCHPVCPRGVDARGAIVWEQWCSPRDPWEGRPLSWFEHDGALASDFVPRFLELWQETDWQRTLREAVFFYTLANRRTIRGTAGIVLAQAALERLTDQWLVANHQSRQGSAAKRLERLCGGLRIPIDVPDKSAVRDLCSEARRLRLTGPQMIGKVRNAIAHARPCGDTRNVSHGDVWMLAIWYLELVILAVCSYRERYSNRLEPGPVGQLEPVPWT